MKKNFLNFLNIMLISLFLIYACVVQADQIFKIDFQVKVKKLVTPFYEGNYQDFAINGKSFQKAYTEWKNKTTNEYNSIRAKKIAELNAVQKHFDEIAAKEKLCRGPSVMVDDGPCQNFKADQYSCFEEYYVHNYNLGFLNYRGCAHTSLNNLNNHVYWIKQWDQCRNEKHSLLEVDGMGFSYLINDTDYLKENKMVETILGKNGSDFKSDDKNIEYEHLLLSDFYEKKLTELNDLIIPYKEALLEEDMIIKKDVLEKVAPKIKSIKCSVVVGQKENNMVLIGWTSNVTCFRKFKNCKLELCYDSDNPFKTKIACSCRHPLSSHKFKFQKGVNESEVLQTLYENSKND